MVKEPCMCGDPYCPRCGNPYLAKIEAAEDGLLDALSEVCQTVEDYEIVKQVGTAAVKAAREYAEKAIKENMSDDQMGISQMQDRIEQLEEEIKGYESFKQSVDEALNSGDGAYRP